MCFDHKEEVCAPFAITYSAKTPTNRTSRWQMFFKTDFARFTGKYMCSSLFLIKLQA